MNTQFLADLETEINRLIDDIEWDWQADRLRAIARKVAAELELTRLRNRTAA